MTVAQCKPFKQKVQIQISTTRGSVCKIDVPAMKSSDPWDNYVTGGPYRDAKINGVSPGFGSQYATRMSVTSHKVGAGMKSFTSVNVSVKPDY